MKNRKCILVVFAVLALLCLGIGYAALSDTLTLNLTINGDGSANNDFVTNEDEENEDKFNIVWTAAVTDLEYYDGDNTHPTLRGDKDVVTATFDSDNDTATFTVDKLGEKGDGAFARYTVKNESALEITATIIASIEALAGNHDVIIDFYFEVSQEDETANGELVATVDATDNHKVTLPQGAQVTLVVKATLNETLAEVETFTNTYTITLDARDHE